MESKLAVQLRRRPRIFKPELQKIRADAVICPRCNKSDLYWLYGMPTIISGYMCIDCLVALVDAIVRVTGIRIGRDHA